MYRAMLFTGISHALKALLLGNKHPCSQEQTAGPLSSEEGRVCFAHWRFEAQLFGVEASHALAVARGLLSLATRALEGQTPGYLSQGRPSIL